VRVRSIKPFPMLPNHPPQVECHVL
jgi:hypothetical protein